MKILILCGHYADGRYSNSICVKNLAECFARQGHNVHIIAWGEKDEPLVEVNGVMVSYVKEPQYPLYVDYYLKKGGVIGHLYTIYHLVHSLLILPLYPNVSSFTARRVYKQAVNIIENNGIDVVLATYTPYDGIWAGLKLKKKYGNFIKFVSYHLDLMSSPDNEGVVKRIKIKKGKKAFEKELLFADKIMIPEGSEIAINSKIKEVGFPLFIKETPTASTNFEYPLDTINLTYIGSLSSSNRNPSLAIRAFELLAKETGKKVTFHIWGVLGDMDCQGIVDKSSCVEYHGIADNNEVALLLAKSDVLINISNSTTYKMIPSKIFQYFAIGKPIIDFVKKEGDVSVPFFEKYPKALLIREYNQEMNEIVAALKMFIDNLERGVIVSADTLFDNYKPKTICKEILN